MGLTDVIRKNKVFAVIRTEDPTKALQCANACIKGGLKLIEVTFSFSGAEEVIRELSRRDDILVGAGTVLNLHTARVAVGSGAKFIVSPHTDGEIISYAKSNNLVVVSGALTSTEILKAWDLGADLIKIFPVKAVGGASYIKAIKEPLPFIEIMTTGGVTLENFTEFLSAGATAVGLSSALIGNNGSLDPEIICQRAKRIAKELGELEKMDLKLS